MENKDKVEILSKEIYQYYHRLSIYHKTGKFPRLIKNWDKPKTSSIWPYIERFANIVERSNGMINYKLFIQALFEFSNGQWFNPKLLVSPKGITIYNHYIKTINDESDPALVKKGINKSIKYIVEFCKKNNLESFEDYFYKNVNIYPPILLHYKAGSISKAFFTLIPNIDKKLANFPPDLIADLFPPEKIKQLITDKILYASMSDTLQKFALNFETIVNYYIKSGINSKK